MTGSISDPNRPWRGFINALTYTLDLRERIGDESVIRIAEAILSGHSFTQAPAVYRQACEDALRNDHVTERDLILRDFLTRLVSELDRRRPWPRAKFTITDQRWDEYEDAPFVGQIPLRKRDVEGVVKKEFRPPASTIGSNIRYLIMRLEDGSSVMLSCVRPFSDPKVEIHSFDDPETTAQSFEQATGIAVVRTKR